MVGVDEVGRGPWAGPVVAAAVALTNNTIISGVKDSKKLTSFARRRLAILIKKQAIGIGVGWVSNEYVDNLGLSAAVKQSMLKAVSQLNCQIDELVIDGNINYLGEEFSNSRAIIDADSTHPAVSAASIIAKVARDQYMASISKLYPNYGFEKHVGYGTKSHRQMIALLGVTPIHRLSFKPINTFNLRSLTE